MDDEGPTVALIAALTDDGVIGREGAIPWDLPEDMRRFRETTTGHPVVMGRRTFENIVEALGEPLAGRTSVVLTTRELDLPEGAVAVGSVADALAAARRDLRERGALRERGVEPVVYVAGGATVYEQFLPLADRLVLTEVHDEYEGDTYFPDVDCSEWVEVERDERGAFSFLTYERRAGDG